MSKPLLSLRNAIANDKAILVVGSGISLTATNGAPCSSWAGLLEHGINFLVDWGFEDKNWSDAQKKLLMNDSPKLNHLLTVATAVTLSLDHHKKMYRWLKESVGGLRIIKPAILEAIKRLDCPIITTNYDDLLEITTGLPPILWQDSHLIGPFVRDEPDGRGIYHVHGHYKTPESIVLDISSYDRIRENSPGEAGLQNLRGNKSFVYLGCGRGINDPHFASFRRWARRALGSDQVDQFFLCRIQDQDQLEKLFQPEDHIVLIPYGKDYDDLAPFLESITSSHKSVSIRSKESDLTVSTPHQWKPLPQKPDCFGRDELLDQVYSAVLGSDKKPLCILGGPGMGKSNLVLNVIHSTKVIERFKKRRLFIRCDGAFSRDKLFIALARNLGLKPDPELENRIYHTLTQAPTLLVLDNAESLWEIDRKKTLEFLQALAGLDSLRLVITFRGGRRPPRISWQDPIHVKPLAKEASKKLFLNIAGNEFKDDPHLDRFILILEGYPLALELLGFQADGVPSLEILMRRWKREKVTMLNEGDSRQENLARSLELSWKSNRMNEDARNLLQILSLLPAGINREIDLATLRENGDKDEAALHFLGLIQDDLERVRTLNPIREYVIINHPLSESQRAFIFEYYLKIAEELGNQVGQIGGAQASNRLQNELLNIELAIDFSLEHSDQEIALRGVKAAIAMGEFARFTGLGTDSQLKQAADITSVVEEIELQASCLNTLGDISLYRSEHEAARAYFERAKMLFEQAGSIQGQANCIRSLGDIALQGSDQNTAAEFYAEALILFEQINDKQGQAKTIQGIGNISYQRSELEDANENYVRASSLFEQIGDIRGQAYCFGNLADIAHTRSSLNEAQDFYKKAKSLLNQVGDIRGQANCLHGLGKLAGQNSNLETAFSFYNEAMTLFEQVKDIRGQANCFHGLGEITLRQSHFDKARDYFKMSQPLYEQIENIPGQAYCAQSLGQIAEQTSKHESARSYYKQAFHFFKQVNDPLGQAKCLEFLGNVAVRERKFIKARKLFLNSQTLYNDAASLESAAEINKKISNLKVDKDPEE